MVENEFCKEFKKAMDERNMTQAELSALTGNWKIINQSIPFRKE